MIVTGISVQNAIIKLELSVKLTKIRTAFKKCDVSSLDDDPARRYYCRT
jgi:hypothetical protein